MALTAGQSLSFYEILGPLGAGGMGEVYHARDTRLERDCAIKVLPEEMAGDEERLRRFEREARTLASLNHLNVAGIHGVDQVDDVCFLALELVPGEDLATRLARGRLPVDEAIDVCRQIAEGLEAAHEAGVVHRDLKPANVRITPEGVVKILDFGLAKPIRPSTSREPGTTTAEPDSFLLTEEGLVLGTPTYMSPEQARGKPVDRRTDIWAFGCVLHECLAGKRAFDGETLGDVLAAVIEREPDWSSLPGSTPRVLRGLMMRCLEKDPRRRLRDIGEARLLLEAGALAEPEPAAGSSSRLQVLLVGAVAGAALLWMGHTFSDGSAPAARGELQLSIRASGVYRGASGVEISPDATRILFHAVSEDGERYLWLRSFDSFEARPIQGTQGRSSSPFWSPDGESIGFFRDGLLRTLRLGDEVSRALPGTEGAGEGAWSPSGEIVYAEPEGALFAVDLAGGEPRPLTELDVASGEVSHWAPTFLPDGDRFLYLAMVRVPGEEREHRLCVGRLSTGETTFLCTFPSIPFYTDRGELVYIDDGNVRAVPFDAASLEFTGEARTLAGGAAFFKPVGRGNLSVARNGSFAFQGASFPSEMRWLDRRGIDRGLAGEASGLSFGYRVSPDGRRVAVGVTDPRNSLSDVWVWGLTRETRTQVTDNSVWDGQPVWTPDGRWLYYASDSEGYPDVFRMPLDPPGPAEPFWSRDQAQFPADVTPDGQALLAIDQDELWELPLDGEGEPSRLSTQVATWTARVSPDGRWVATTSTRTGELQVYLLERGVARREFQITVDGGREPAWDPREGHRHLYYVTQGNQVWEVDLSTDEKIAEPEPAILFEAGRPIDVLEVMPDGERFLVRYREDENQPISVVLRGER
jgi:serine/threonine protein kinase